MEKRGSYLFIFSILVFIFLSSDVLGLNVNLPYSEDFDDDSYEIDDELVNIEAGGIPGWNGQTHTYMPSGGWSGGAAHFTPPIVRNAPSLNGQYAGISGITFPAEPVIHVRFLVRWSSNWEENAWFPQDGYGTQDKMVILTTQGGSRGMTVFEKCRSAPCTDTGQNYYTWGACEDNSCIYEGDPTRYSPRGNDAFKSSDYPEEWVSVELMVSSDDYTEVYIHTQDGNLSGHYLNATNLDPNQITGNIIGLEGAGWFFNGFFTNGTWFEIDELAIDTQYIGPPVGFVGGACTPSCGGNVCGSDGCSGSCGSCNATSSCVSGVCEAVSSLCGNENIIDAGETCDGTNLGIDNCITQGFTGGSLACNSDCLSFDTSGCTNPLPINCTDNDNDGYNQSATECGVVDCDDTNYNLNVDCSPPTGCDSNNPDIFFCEDFESGVPESFLSDFYGNLASNSQWNIQSQTTSSGNYALRYDFIQGDNMHGRDYVTQHFGDSSKSPVWVNGLGNSYQDIYTQFKVYYSPGFDWSSGNNKLMIFGTEDSVSHANICCNPWVSHYATLLLGGSENNAYFTTEINNKDSTNNWRGIDPNTNGYDSQNRYYVQSGQWYTIEFHKRLNDVGQNNGIFEMWIDGEKVTEYNDVLFRVPWDGTYGSNFSYGSNFIMLSTYINDLAVQDQEIYYDDIKSSSSYIGTSLPQQCPGDAHEADDSPCDGCVSQGELQDYINRWLADSTDVTIEQAASAIDAWSTGSC